MLLLLATSTSFSESFEPFEIKLVVTYSKGSYWLGDKRIESELINKLINSANMPPVKKWQFPMSKRKWFKSNTRLALDEFLYRNSFKNPTLEQRNLFINTFKTYRNKPIDIDSYWPHPGRDGFGTVVSLLIQAKDGTEYHFLSMSPYPILEPWGVTYEDKSFDTYLPTISPLIVRLIPVKQRPDIESHSALRSHIIKLMMANGLERKWQTLHIKRHLRPAYDALNKNFSINYLKVANIATSKWLDEDIDDERLFPDFELQGFDDARLEISLGHTNAPKNVSMYLELSVKNHSVIGIEKAISIAKAEFTKVISLTRLVQHLRENPNRYLTIKSASDKIGVICSNADFCHDIRLSTHKFIIPPLGDLFKSSLHFTLTDSNERKNNSHWLLLSTNQLFLWRYSGKFPYHLPSNLSKHSIVDRNKCVFSVVPFKIFNVASKNWFGIKAPLPKRSK